MKKTLECHINNFVQQQYSQKTIDDYYRFFTTPEGADMSSYMYLNPYDHYDNLMRYSQAYYLCREHIELIKQYKTKFEHYLKSVTDIVEIGPGSDYVIENKTILFLSYAHNLKKYHIIDNCKKYLDETSTIIKNYKNELNIHTIEANLTQKNSIDLSHISNGKKCILFLGGTIANFHEIQQKQCIKNIYNMLDKDDIFILTVDINQNEQTLLAAYQNKYAINFINGVLNYYTTINPNFKKYASLFEIKCLWDKEEKCICISFIAKNNIVFKFSYNTDIIIKKNQELKGIRAYKKNQQENINFLNQNGFKVIDVLGSGNNIKEFICTKI